MAPEHPDVLRLNDSPEVHEYVNRALTESAEERGDEHKEKTGVALERTVTNPVNGEQIPMFVADYVLMEYGTGAIMAVPAHDQRDFEFAERFGLPIGRVIEGVGEEAFVAYTGDGRWSTPAASTGCTTARPTTAIVDWLERGLGEPAVNYRLRDWLLSRQRYWGCPIPMVHCESLRPRPGARRPAAGGAARHRGLRAEGPLAAGRGGGLGATRPARAAAARPARDGHDGHLRRLVLVLPALLRPAQRGGALGPARCSTAGCRSTSTSAGSSTRSCT